MNSQARLCRRRRLPVAAVGTVLLLAAVGMAVASPGHTVYYQVTYTDGSSRDLSAVPDSDKGIARVLRITRIEQGVKGYEIMSTGPQTLTLVSRGQTYKTDLAWNGKAWVFAAPAPISPVAATAPAPAPAAGTDEAEALRLKAALVELAAKLLEANERLAASEKAMDPNSAAATAVAKARQEMRTCVATLLDGSRKLSRPGQPLKPPGKPTGKIAPLNVAPDRSVGIARPIGSVAVLPHSVQVWPLTPTAGRRTYGVAMAHPEAGAAGGFYYVAYADTTGDGRPDKLIARSPFAQAPKARQWTQWQFATGEKNVFVGTAWDRSDTVHYHAEAVRIDDNWRGLPNQAYISVDPWGLPLRTWGPCVGNIKVWVKQ